MSIIFSQSNTTDDVACSIYRTGYIFPIDAEHPMTDGRQSGWSNQHGYRFQSGMRRRIQHHDTARAAHENKGEKKKIQHLEVYECKSGALELLSLRVVGRVSAMMASLIHRKLKIG